MRVFVELLYMLSTVSFPKSACVIGGCSYSLDLSICKSGRTTVVFYLRKILIFDYIVVGKKEAF